MTGASPVDRVSRDEIVAIASRLISIPSTSGEERAVIQILVNLIGNALKHSPDGGTVRLDFARTPGTVSVTVAV